VRKIRLSALLLGAGLFLSVSCEPLPSGHSDGGEGGLQTRVFEQRPTDGAGWQGNGYGTATVRSFDTRGGELKIWYATDGVHAVPSADLNPADGTPDFVQTVGKHADRSFDVIINQHGFRHPLDDSIYHDRPDYGGDSRFDIYLQNISNSDGYRVTEVCVEVPFICAGYLVIENDFVGYFYPSADVAIKTLTGHELMHGIIDAYDADQPAFVNEGTATWAQELVFPEQDDFEGFIDIFFAQPERALDSARPQDLGDLYPYATAIWPRFLQERFEVEAVRLIFEGLVDTPGVSPEYWQATDDVLTGAYSSSLSDAFMDFAIWNLFTGRRAGQLAGYGYASAADYPELFLGIDKLAAATAEGVALQQDYVVERLSAQYFSISSGLYGGQTIDVEARGRARFVLLVDDKGTVAPPVLLRPAGAFDRAELTLPVGSRILLAVVNPNPEKETNDGTLIISAREPVEVDAGLDVGVDAEDVAELGLEAESTQEQSDDCGCQVQRTPSRLPGLLLVALLLASCWRGARREPRIEAPRT